MAFELFAAMTAQDERQFGWMIGVTFAVIVCSAIPTAIGLQKNQPVLGVIGGVCAAGSAFVAGCCLGLPVAGVFVVIINLVANMNDSQARRQADDDYVHRRRRERGMGQNNGDDNDW
jgi:hypothetical protein